MYYIILTVEKTKKEDIPMFTLPPLPYGYDALEPYIDTKTMQIHHDKHHAAYVNNTNGALVDQEELLALPIDELIKNLDRVPEQIRTKVKNNAGGHFNHSMFWLVMAPSSTVTSVGKPQAVLADAMNSAFGSFEKFQETFAAAGVGRFGSGWVWLSVENKKLIIEDSPNQDNPLMFGRTPILCLDVWEHAYYLKYQNLRADYIQAWWNVVNWTEVEKRYVAALG
jgi:superoxide dismutase, Fe-Mn family